MQEGYSYVAEGKITNIGSRPIPTLWHWMIPKLQGSDSTQSKMLLSPPQQCFCFPALQETAFLSWSHTCPLQALLWRGEGARSYSMVGASEGLCIPRLGYGMQKSCTTHRWGWRGCQHHLVFCRWAALPWLPVRWTSDSPRDHVRGRKEICPRDSSTLQTPWDLEPKVQNT